MLFLGKNQRTTFDSLASFRNEKPLPLSNSLLAYRRLHRPSSTAASSRKDRNGGEPILDRESGSRSRARRGVERGSKTASRAAENRELHHCDSRDNHLPLLSINHQSLSCSEYPSISGMTNE